MGSPEEVARQLNQQLEQFVAKLKWHPWYAWYPVRLRSKKLAWRRVIMVRAKGTQYKSANEINVVYSGWEYEEPFIVALNQD